MKIESNIDNILDELVKKGSNIEDLKHFREKSLSMVKKDEDLNEVLGHISRDIKDQTEAFLNSKNQYGTNYITGVSTCIYLPDYENNGEYKLKLIGGKTGRTRNIKVDENTLFDVASITKVFTLLLLFKLEELGYINLNDRVCDINPDFQNLEDFTLNDLVRLHGELKTNGNIAQASSTEEAYEMLKTLYLVSDSREENKYTDFGAIVISDTIEKVLSNIKGEKVTFEEVMYEYLLSPIGLYQTQFNPNTHRVSGNGNTKRLVHDPKARILGGAVGSAGIFTTSDDLARLAKCLYKVNYVNRGLIKKSKLERLGEVTFPNSSQSNKGNLGIYVKHPLGYEKTFTPPEFSTGSFSHQGWTGSIAAFDPNNLIHNNILVNAIYEDENKDKVRADKPIGFGTAFGEYQKQITKNIMIMYVAKKYYNKYCNVRENIEVTKFIK